MPEGLVIFLECVVIGVFLLATGSFCSITMWSSLRVRAKRVIGMTAAR